MLIDIINFMTGLCWTPRRKRPTRRTGKVNDNVRKKKIGIVT